MFLIPIESLIRFGLLVLKSSFHSFGKPGICKPMETVGYLRIKTAKLFVMSSCTWLKIRQAAFYSVLDRCVVADIEMQVTNVLEASPISTIERRAFDNVERACNYFLLSTSDDETEPTTKALTDEVKEILI